MMADGASSFYRSPALAVYRALTFLLAPFIWLYLHYRLLKGQEERARFHERCGYASVERPEGRVLWCHAASVGEALSVLTLIHHLKKKHPQWTFLLTTVTIESSELVKDRLSDGILHHYVPVDLMPYVSRFLDHWKPDLVLWIESELWPNLLMGMEGRRVPTILLNGRMSDKSFRNWSFFNGAAKHLLSFFDLCLAQTEIYRDRFAALGARKSLHGGNLKYSADPLPYDAVVCNKLTAMIGDRPVWMVVSTHPGEEEIVLRMHKALKKRHKNLLTILVPRHPDRGVEIAGMVRNAGLVSAQRRLKNEVLPRTDIYIADTMGEMGSFFKVCPIVLMGGTFTWGGHNPVEPAHYGCSILMGPLMTNFPEITKDICDMGAAKQLFTEEALVDAVDELLKNPDTRAAMSEKALVFAEAKKSVLPVTLEILEPYFKAVDVL